jgi:hypothetical protein
MVTNTLDTLGEMPTGLLFFLPLWFIGGHQYVSRRREGRLLGRGRSADVPARLLRPRTGRALRLAQIALAESGSSEAA